MTNHTNIKSTSIFKSRKDLFQVHYGPEIQKGKYKLCQTLSVKINIVTRALWPKNPGKNTLLYTRRIRKFTLRALYYAPK